MWADHAIQETRCVVGTSWDVSEGIALCSAKLGEKLNAQSTHRDGLECLMNSVLLSAQGCLQTGNMMISLLLKRLDLTFLVWLGLSTGNKEFGISSIGYWCWRKWFASHCFRSVCIPPQVCVNLNLAHPTCSGLYLIWTLGSFCVYLQLVEELAENVNWLSVPCVLTTRWHHTLSIFCERFQWNVSHQTCKLGFAHAMHKSIFQPCLYLNSTW